MATKMAAYAAHQEMQARLEAQMRAQGQSAGLRQLRQMLARKARGEAGVCVEVWRTAMQDAGRVAEMERVRRELAAQAAELAAQVGGAEAAGEDDDLHPACRAVHGAGVLRARRGRRPPRGRDHRGLQLCLL